MKLWLKRIVTGGPLSPDEAAEMVAVLLQADPVEQAAALAALARRGETADELAGAVRAVRAVMIPAEAPDDAIDVCGTGGDGVGTLNVSTAVALVVAACGVPVAKHGNRAASSHSGTADVLEGLGLRLSLDAAGRARCFADAQMAFLFAPDFHPALVRLAPVRRALGFRTLFNLTGPLANPARVARQLIGVFDPSWTEPVAAAFAANGGTAAWVVCGDEGGRPLDEISISGPTRLHRLQAGRIEAAVLTPDDAGLPRHPPGALAGGDPAHNAAAIRDLLNGAPGAYRDAVCLNAAAALVISDPALSLPAAAAEAAAALDNGRARGVLDALVRASQF